MKNLKAAGQMTGSYDYNNRPVKFPNLSRYHF